MDEYTSDNPGLSGNLKCLSAGSDFKHNDLKRITRRYVCKKRDKDFSDCEEYKGGKGFSEIFYCGDDVVSNIVYAMKNGEGGDQSLIDLLKSTHIGHFDWWIFPWQYKSNNNNYKLSYDPEIRKRQYQYLLNQQIIVGQKLAKSLQEAVEKLLDTNNLLKAHYMRKWKVLISIYQYWEAATESSDKYILRETLELLITKFLGSYDKTEYTPPDDNYDKLTAEDNPRPILNSQFNTFGSVLKKIKDLLTVEVSISYAFLEDSGEEVISQSIIDIINEQNDGSWNLPVKISIYDDSILILNTEMLLFKKLALKKFWNKFKKVIFTYTEPYKDIYIKSIHFYLTTNISTSTVAVNVVNEQITNFMRWFENALFVWRYHGVRFANNNLNHFKVYQNLVLFKLRDLLYNDSYMPQPFPTFNSFVTKEKYKVSKRKPKNAAHIVLIQNNNVLLLQHTSGKWGTPGGLVDIKRSGQEETYFEAMKREFKEEVGKELPRLDSLDHVDITFRNNFKTRLYIARTDTDLAHYLSKSSLQSREVTDFKLVPINTVHTYELRGGVRRGLLELKKQKLSNFSELLNLSLG